MSQFVRDEQLPTDDPHHQLQAEQRSSSDQVQADEHPPANQEIGADSEPRNGLLIKTDQRHQPGTDHPVRNDPQILNEGHVLSAQPLANQRLQFEQDPQTHYQQVLVEGRVPSSPQPQIARHREIGQQPRADQQLEPILQSQVGPQPQADQNQTAVLSQNDQAPKRDQQGDQQASQQQLLPQGRHHRQRHRRHHHRPNRHPDQQDPSRHPDRSPDHHRDPHPDRDSPHRGDQTGQRQDLDSRDLKSDQDKKSAPGDDRPELQADHENPEGRSVTLRVAENLITVTPPASTDNPDKEVGHLGDKRLQSKKGKKKHADFVQSSSTDIRTRDRQSSVALARLNSVLTNEGTMLPDELIVGHSTYQLMVLATAHISAFMMVFHVISIHLLSKPVDHWCKPPAQYAHLPPEAWKNTSIPSEGEGRYSQCTMYDPPYVLFNDTRQVVSCVAWEYDLQPGVETMVSQWNLVCGNHPDLSLITVYSVVAQMLSIPVVAQVSDKAGRRNVIYVCIVGAVVTWCAVFLATCYVLFNVGRIFLSIVLNTLRMVTFILLFEVTSPEYRDFYISLAQCGVVVALTTAAVLDCFIVSKRTILTVGMVPAGLLIFAIYTVEESPRWLVTRWEFEQVRKVLKWVYRVNGTNFQTPPLDKHHQIKRSEAFHELIQVTILDLLSQPALRNRTIVIGGVWFCLICSYYATWQLIPKTCDVALLLVVTVPHVATVPLSYVLLRLYGRKASLSVVCALSGGLACVLTASTTLPDYVVAILRHLTLSTLLLNFFICYVFTLELYPTVMRTMGFCTAILFGKLGSIASYFVKEQSNVHPSVPDILIAASMVWTLVLLSWLPETKYTKVADTIYDIEAQVVRGIVVKMYQK